MNNEIDNFNVHLKDVSTEKILGLEKRPKSKDFLYVDINEYNENNLDSIDIREEEERVKVFNLKKKLIEFSEFGSGKSFPLNVLNNSAKHSEQETCLENSREKIGSSNELFKKNISGTSEKNCYTIGNPESKEYKLRGETCSQKIDFNLLKNDIERGEKKDIVCMGCGMTFLNENSFLSHEGKTDNFKCEKCFKCFCTDTLLNMHLKSCKFNENKYTSLINKNFKNHIVSLFKCGNCNKIFLKKVNLVIHLKKNLCSFKLYTCDYCEETVFKKSKLRKHIVAHLNRESRCLETVENHQNLNNHSTNVIDNKDFNSELKIQSSNNDGVDKEYTECNKNNRSEEFAETKSSKDDLFTIFKCQICNENFKGTISYENHKKKCDISNKDNINTYKRKNPINDNIFNESKVKNRKKFKYECDICGKRFIKLIRLKIHILNIHFGVNFQCGNCNAKFPNQEDLDIHVNEKNCIREDLSTCKTCGKVFAKKINLKKHQYMHLNILFKCKYCYGAFIKEKSYKRHMEKKNCSKSARKIRMAEFNYKKCRLCEIEYKTEELLIKHFKKSHVGLNPHQCFCCDSCLPTFQDLQSHIHYHNIQKYTCNLCGKPYTSQEGFRKHRLKHKGAELKCKFCDSQFLSEGRFKFHEKTCKKNPENGYEPSQEKEKPKKKDGKPKQSRQLHWESRIIMKRLRGDPKQPAGNQTNSDRYQPDSAITSAFFDESDSDTSDERGWFSNYYKINEDDIAFGLKKPDKSTLQSREPDLDMSEFLRTRSINKKKKISSSSSTEPNSNSDEYDGSYESSSDESSSDSDEVQIKDLPIDYNPKKCRFCVINFSHEYELLHHFIKTHPGKSAHKCPQCEVQTPLYAQLKEHLKSHGIGIGIFNCDNCSKQFRSEKKMKNHKILCKGINITESVQGPKIASNFIKNSCKKCKKKFRSKLDYLRHKKACKKREHKTKNPVKNVKKKESAFNDSSASAYLHISESEKDDEDWEVLKAKDKLVLPDISANTENSKGKKPSVESLNTDKLVEEQNNEVKLNFIGEPPLDSFPCRLCDKKFQYERGIVMHFKAAHPGHKPLICHVCNMHLADKLKEHLKTHGIGEEFICELCGKRFNQKFLSKIHEMWHEGVEYKCNNCKQKFLNKEKMDKHIGENRCRDRQSLMRLPCDICGKSYRSKFGLSKHYITHTPKELRPVKNRMNCEYCGKWFEYNNGLQRHRRIHTGERPFCCRFCPKAFSQEGNCRAHERIHMGESKSKKVETPTSPDIVIPEASVLNSQIALIPPLPPTPVHSLIYPEHINFYNYNNTDPSRIVN